MLRQALIDGVLAGCLISFGGTVLLSCDNRYAGALLFCIALLSICWFGFNLYTGKVGFLVADHSKNALSAAYLGLLGNLLGTLLLGFLVSLALPALKEAAQAACGKRLTQLPLQSFLRGCFCGVMMYVAVWVFRERKTVLGILFCIPVFILAGFEHYIADMFYFSLSGTIFRPASLLFLLLVVLGNSVGGMFIPLLQLLRGKEAP